MLKLDVHYFVALNEIMAPGTAITGCKKTIRSGFWNLIMDGLYC